MAATTMVHVRMDEEIKRQATETLAAMGLSVSDAVRVFLMRVIAEKRMPFVLNVPNAETRLAMPKADEIAHNHRIRMRPSVVLDMKRSAVREAVNRFRTANPRVFGSVLHGTDQDDSDLDLLVDALPGATLFDLGGLQDELESLLGVHVDLLTPGDLSLKFREKVLAEAKPV